MGTSDTFVGIDMALAADLAKTPGVRLQVVPTTWTTMMDDLGDDSFDLAIGGISVSLERQRKPWFSIPYLRDGKTPMHAASTPGNSSRWPTSIAPRGA